MHNEEGMRAVDTWILCAVVMASVFWRGFAFTSTRALPALHAAKMATHVSRSHSIMAMHTASRAWRRPSFHGTVMRYSSSSSSNDIGEEIVVVQIPAVNATKTEALGARLGAHCKNGDVILLSGYARAPLFSGSACNVPCSEHPHCSDLGAGKTTFTRGILRAIFKKPSMKITSPSFLLDNYYEFYPFRSVSARLLRAGKEKGKLSLITHSPSLSFTASITWTYIDCQKTQT